MLPPFRVRCLQRPASPGPSIQTKNTFDALVRISAPEYDNTVRVCPEASLKYLDNDDGETITVGSSLELIQRLESPIYENYLCLPRIKSLLNSSDKLNFTKDGPYLTTQNYPIFGIDCRISSLETWREIERRSNERGLILQSPSCSQLMETGAAPKNERDLLLSSDREHWEETASPVSSYRSVIAEHVCADDLRVHIDESDDVSRLLELEDYRTAYFQLSNPPQVKSLPSAAGSRETDSELKSDMSHSFMENSRLASATAYPACNLTLEGKRQAQAAGDKLRSRTTPSRRKREITASFDQGAYQNRWASYNDPTSSFHPGSLAGFNQHSNEPKLSSEGKRQPQLAGDKLRCRTNPVRHAKSLRGPIDYGINKNRRCSIAGSRVIHCNDRAEPFRSTESLEAGTQGKIEMQPSLLQVFEAELAKVPSKPSPIEHKEVITNLDLPDKKPLGPSSVEPYFLAEEAIRDAKIPSNGIGPMGPQPCVQVLELALRATLSTFGTCVTQIANCVQEVSTTMQLADKTREIDIQVLDNAVASFRSFTEGIAALKKGFHREPESTEESRAKTDQRDNSSSLQDDQALKSSRTVILWPIPSDLESKDIQDILLLHTTRVKSVLISEASERGLRLAFCEVKDNTSAQIISRKMAGQMLNDTLLKVIIVPALGDGFVREEHDVFERLASQHSSLALQNPSMAAPPLTASLSPPAIQTSGIIDVAEEGNQSIKPAATDLTFTNHSKRRFESKPAKPVSLLSSYSRSEDRLKISNHAKDSVETATQVDRRDPNPQTISAGTGDMQPLLEDTAVTCPDLNKGISCDSQEVWSSRRSPKNLRPASIVPLYNTPTNVLRHPEPGPLHLKQDGAPVLHCNFSLQNQSYLKSHRAASRSGPLPSDEFAEPELDPTPVPYTPLALARDLREIHSSDQPLLNSTQSKDEGHSNPLPESSVGRIAFGQKNAVRACRSMGTLFQGNDPVDHRQSQAGETITGKDERARASLRPNLLSMPFQPVPDDFRIKKTYLPNGGARSSTESKNFQSSGSSSKVSSLQDHADVEQSNGAINTSAFSEQRGLSGGLDQHAETSQLTSRFPTLEQFEGRHLKSASKFPIGPSVISLTDPRPRAQSTGAQTPKPQDSSLSVAENSESTMPEIWDDEKRLSPIAPDTTESSGEFFNRMTRLACDSMTYHVPSPSTSERSSTGLRVPAAGNISSQSNITTAYRTRLTDNVRRSATTAGLNDTRIRNNRRPYSENFSGQGRVTWDSFLHRDEKKMDNYSRAVAAATNQEAQTVRNVIDGRAPFAFEDGEFKEAEFEMRDVSFAGEHSDAASVQKVQECVSHLQSLGFGKDADGGMKRLIVYAQAAEGDLVGAIDIIDEEQRAYKERHPRR